MLLVPSVMDSFCSSKTLNDWSICFKQLDLYLKIPTYLLCHTYLDQPDYCKLKFPFAGLSPGRTGLKGQTFVICPGLFTIEAQPIVKLLGCHLIIEFLAVLSRALAEATNKGFCVKSAPIWSTCVRLRGVSPAGSPHNSGSEYRFILHAVSQMIVQILFDCILTIFVGYLQKMCKFQILSIVEYLDFCFLNVIKIQCFWKHKFVLNES